LIHFAIGERSEGFQFRLGDRLTGMIIFNAKIQILPDNTGNGTVKLFHNYNEAIPSDSDSDPGSGSDSDPSVSPPSAVFECIANQIRPSNKFFRLLVRSLVSEHSVN
jgi:hypothetical protein